MNRPHDSDNAFPLLRHGYNLTQSEDPSACLPYLRAGQIYVTQA